MFGPLNLNPSRISEKNWKNKILTIIIEQLKLWCHILQLHELSPDT